MSSAKWRPFCLGLHLLTTFTRNDDVYSHDTQEIFHHRYSDVIMSDMASQNTSLVIVYSNVYSGADQRKHQSSALLAFVRGIHRLPTNLARMSVC